MTIQHPSSWRNPGVFFDDLNNRDPKKLLAFAAEGLNSVGPAYAPIVYKHKDDPFTIRNNEWQGIRRGRYVEFNLGYDLGLKIGGRIEPI